MTSLSVQSSAQFYDLVSTQHGSRGLAKPKNDDENVESLHNEIIQFVVANMIFRVHSPISVSRSARFVSSTAPSPHVTS